MALLPELLAHKNGTTFRVNNFRQKQANWALEVEHPRLPPCSSTSLSYPTVTPTVNHWGGQVGSHCGKVGINRNRDGRRRKSGVWGNIFSGRCGGRVVCTRQCLVSVKFERENYLARESCSRKWIQLCFQLGDVFCDDSGKLQITSAVCFL